MNKLVIITFVLFLYSLTVETKEDTFCSYQELFQSYVDADEKLRPGSTHTFSKYEKDDSWYWHEEKAFIKTRLPALDQACKSAPRTVATSRAYLSKEQIPEGHSLDTHITVAGAKWAKEALYQALTSGETIKIEKTETQPRQAEQSE